MSTNNLAPSCHDPTCINPLHHRKHNQTSNAAPRSAAGGSKDNMEADVRRKLEVALFTVTEENLKGLKKMTGVGKKRKDNLSVEQRAEMEKRIAAVEVDVDAWRAELEGT